MMNNRKKDMVLFLLLVTFIMMFKFSGLVHTSVIEGVELFFSGLVPSMLPMFIMIDLLLNYGLANKLYKMFKSNAIILILLSLLSGTPSNAKYIREFYKDGYISKDMGNLLLMFAYSPNPLFVMAFFPIPSMALPLLLYIYISNFVIFLLFKRKFPNLSSVPKEFKSEPFVVCLSNSIYKSAHILVLILGIVITFGIANSFLYVLNVGHPFFYSILELSNAFELITGLEAGILWMTFAATFGGLSIHAQIKSILEDTDLSYRYFLIGRLLASIPVLIMAILN